MTPFKPRLRLTCFVVGEFHDAKMLLYGQKLDQDMPLPTLENTIFHVETRTGEARNITVVKTNDLDLLPKARDWMGKWQRQAEESGLAFEFHFYDERTRSRPQVVNESSHTPEPTPASRPG